MLRVEVPRKVGSSKCRDITSRSKHADCTVPNNRVPIVLTIITKAKVLPVIGFLLDLFVVELELLLSSHFILLDC